MYLYLKIKQNYKKVQIWNLSHAVLNFQKELQKFSAL